jgi:hypothetical protein
MSALWRVQELDLDIARDEEALAALDTGAEMRAQAEQLRADLAAARAARQELDKLYLDRDLELRTLDEKKKTNQARLFSGKVRNPRELSDLEKEVAMLTREADRLADMVYELLEKLNAQTAVVAQQQAALTTAEGELAGIQERYASAAGQLTQELESLRAAREEAAGQVPAALLRRYDLIRGHHDNVGVSRVANGACSGCHVAISDDQMRAVKSSAAPQTCETCGRLLYWGEVAAADDDAPEQDA